MSKQYKRLNCKDCIVLLKRSYSNEYLNRNYPVDPSNPNHRDNMKFHRFSKRLWDCPICRIRYELSFIQYVLIIIDNLLGRYIKYE